PDHQGRAPRGAGIRAAAPAQRVRPSLHDHAGDRAAAPGSARGPGRAGAGSRAVGRADGRWSWLMASMNRVFLIGNLVRPPELRYTPSGTAVSDLRVAVNRDYTTQSGERRQETDFLTVVVWGKQAETSAQYLDKGSPVLVEGRLQTREWEGKDGQRRN